MINIYQANDITEAHIVSGMLRAHGIEAFVGGHYQQGGVGELAPVDFASVQIHDDDESQARELLADYDQTQKLQTLDQAGNKHSLFNDIVVVLFVLFVAVSLYFLMFA